MVTLAGCNLGAPKQAAAPPPPKPAAVQPPAPDPQLSIPQTAVTLPGAQPVNPDAIPPVQTAQTPAPPKPDPATPVRASRHTAAVQQKSDPEPETETAPGPAAQEQAPIQPILGPDEQKKIHDTIDGRRREIEGMLSHAKARLSSHDKSLVERIHSFLGQCTQAEQRGDYSQADALSQRALILAQELQRE
jgi:hypothetical protein